MSSPPTPSLRILALEAYYGGSHRAFLDGWAVGSAHDWTLLTLPPNKWKWRMRHAAITFADQVAGRSRHGEAWDAIFCSDMLNLAEFKGLAPPAVRNLPAIVYFHENQLTYPVRHETERDYHFVLTNMTTALAADRVWFNSAYHRDAFLEALPTFLKRMPDHHTLSAVDAIRARSEIHPPGIEAFPARDMRPPGPLHLLWAARWEHDKNPELFFETLRLVQKRGVPFRLSVVGEQFRDAPAIFAEAEREFAERIIRWGYQPSREAYRQALLDVDVIISTANHEFFGISVVEAMLAGAYPLLPKRLAYPEILAGVPDAKHFFYDGSVDHLAKRIAELSEQVQRGEDLTRAASSARKKVEAFQWDRLRTMLDHTIAQA